MEETCAVVGLSIEGWIDRKITIPPTTNPWIKLLSTLRFIGPSSCVGSRLSGPHVDRLDRAASKATEKTSRKATKSGSEES
jgi:hypothetical protein